jgi:glyceraldehyde-3-phosphate dehydrogenase (NADP+)
VSVTDLEVADPILVGTRWWTGDEVIRVTSPYSGEHVATVAKAGREQIEEALDAAVATFQTTSTMPTHERARILRAISDAVAADREGFATTLVSETGKSIRDARVEADRCITTFAVAAEEASQVEHEVVNMDRVPPGVGRFAINGRFPIGVVLGITPFNFPLNLVAHKVAPAIAAGNTVVLKPATATPLSALRLARVIEAAGWPAGGFSVIPTDSSEIERYIDDDRVAKLTFTGSAEVGWHLKRLAWRKKVTLELGGNAGTIVHEDADIAHAAGRIAAGAFGFAGQSCISVQRVFVHRPVYDAFLDELVERVRGLRRGDPSDEATDVVPMITVAAAEKAERLVREALESGARVLVGGGRDGAFFEPTVLVDAAPTLDVCRTEAFAPLVAVSPYDDFAEAVKAVDDSDFGLQAGVFTRDVGRIWAAWRGLHVGGVLVNEIPTFRADPMPYGGVKGSGWGREGLRYAIEDMTEPRLMVLTLPA